MKPTAGAVEERKSIFQVAFECYKQADGDWSQAECAMLDIIANNANLRYELTEPLIRAAVHNEIAKIASMERYKLKPVEDNNVDGILFLSSHTAKSMLDYPLASGLKLGNASTDDLINEAITRERQALTNKRNALWMRKIIAGMGKAKIVRNKFNDEDLRRLQLDAFNAV